MFNFCKLVNMKRHLLLTFAMLCLLLNFIEAAAQQSLFVYGDITRSEFVKQDMKEQQRIYRDMSAGQRVLSSFH